MLMEMLILMFKQWPLTLWTPVPYPAGPCRNPMACSGSCLKPSLASDLQSTSCPSVLVLGVKSNVRFRGGKTNTASFPSSSVASSVSGVWVVAAVTADLDLQRRQVVQPALFHLVGHTLLFLFDHGAPHPLQRWVVFLLLLFFLLSVTLSSVVPPWRGGVHAWRLAARSAVVTSSAAAVVVVVVVTGAKSAPQAACRQERVNKHS